MKKKAADASAKTIIGSKNTKEAISIQKKQHMITERKKNFGLEYIDLVLRQQQQQQQPILSWYDHHATIINSCSLK